MQARRPFFILALGFSMWAAVAAGVTAKPKPCRMKDPDLSVFGIRLGGRRERGTPSGFRLDAE